MVTRLAARVGLDRPELRAWAMYDWANSAFFTVVVTAVYPIWFGRFAAGDLPPGEAAVRHGWTTTIALTLVAVMGPVLGAVADFSAAKKRLLTLFLGLGAGATAALFFVGGGQWAFAAGLFVAANVGAMLSLTFYDSLLPHVAGEREIDRVSTAGYALGYVGGGLLLALCLVAIQRPATFGISGSGPATRIAYVAVAVWWVVFSIPLLRRVAEPPRRLGEGERADANPLIVAFARLRETLGELRGYRQAFLFLLAVLVYNDGITTIYRMATIYGTELGLEPGDMITAILLVQFLGVPFAFLFGGLAGRAGAKRAILIGLTVYLGIGIFGFFVRTIVHFYVLAIAVATVQGGTQALSRSLFASLIPASRSSQFFGFYGVAERFAAVLGPLVFTLVTGWTGSVRHAVLAICGFFLAGGALLMAVRVDEGRAAARRASESA